MQTHRAFTDVIRHLTSRPVVSPLPRTVRIAGTEFSLPSPQNPPSTLDATVEAAIDLARKAQKRAMGALGSGIGIENEGLRDAVGEFAEDFLGARVH